jgi:hypothetical protein
MDAALPEAGRVARAPRAGAAARISPHAGDLRAERRADLLDVDAREAHRRQLLPASAQNERLLR